MQNKIASYLFQHKSCPLPGLGTLSVINTGAEVDFSNKQIHAPQTIICFNDTETDAAGLLSYLSATSGVDQHEAEQALGHFCNSLKAGAGTNWDSIGSFHVDASGKISFTPEALPAAFAQPVIAERVIHPDVAHQIRVGDKETTTTVMTELLNEQPEAKDRWWIWAIVLGVIALVVLLIYFTGFKGSAGAFGNAVNYIHS